jgi:hypothetical protein
MYGEEGLKGGAPPPSTPAGADGMPSSMPGGAQYFHFGGPGGGSYSGMDSARAANIFASLFGQNPEAFGGAFGGGGGPRSRVRMFQRNQSGKRGMEDLFGEGGGTHYYHDGGMGARPAGSGTTGYAWGGGGEQPEEG